MLNVLIIEDEWLIRAELHKMLRQFSFIGFIVEAGTVAEALQQGERHKPDVVFLDIQLPDGSGFDFLQQFGHAFALIFITAYDHYQISAKKYHPCAYLMKPVNKKKLQKVMQEVKELHYAKQES